MRFAYELPLWWQRTFPLLSRALESPDFDAFQLLRWTTQAVLVSLLIFLADYLLGAGLLLLLFRRYPLRIPGPLRIALSLALGNGIGGMLVFLLGLAHWLTAGLVVGSVVVSGLAGGWLLWRYDGLAWARRPWVTLRPSRRSLALIVLFLPALVLHEFDLQLPVLEGDSTLYHMADARWYADHQRLAYHPGIRFNAQPQQTVLVYLRHWLTTGEETQLKLVNWEYLAMLIGTLLGGARLVGAGPWGSTAILLMLASPVFCWMGKVEMADFGLAAYLSLGVVLLLRALRQPNPLWCALGGLMLGFAAASKLQGLLTVAGFGLCWLAVAWLSGYWPLRLLLRQAIPAIAAGVILPGVGWWIRSYVHTGSPVYPFFSGSPESKALFAASVRYGFGHDWVALLALPWRMVTESSYVFADPYIFGIPLLLLILAGAAALWRTRARVSPEILFLLGGFLIYFSFWFLTGQVMRYLATLLPVIVLMTVAALAALGWRRPRWMVLAPLALVALLATLTPSRILLHGILPPVTNQQLLVAQITALPYYRTAAALNRIVDPRERVYLWFCEDVRFHVRAMSYGDWFGSYNFAWLGRNGASTQQMIDRLRNVGFRYIVVDRDRTRRGGTIYPGSDFLKSAFVQDEGPSGDAQLIIREGRYRVFKLD